MGQRGPQPTRPCGTEAAYARHLRKGEPPCDLCAAGHHWANDLAAYWRVRAVMAARESVAADLRNAIGLLALAFTTPPDREAS